MATAHELQSIIREMNSGLRSLVREQQNFLSNLLENKESDHTNRRSPNSKNSKGEPSATSSMNINRRLSGSVRKLTSEVDSLSNTMSIFARNVRIASRQVSRNPSSNNSTNGSNNQTDNDGQLASEIRDLVHQLRSNGGNNSDDGGDGGNGEGSNFKTWATDFTKKMLGKFSIVAGLRKGLNEVQLAASKSGVYDIGATNLDAVMMGMDTSELIEMQAQHRQSTLRATYGINQWTDTIRDATTELLPYTGTLKEAAKVTATLQTNLLNIGFNFQEANDVIGDQNNGFIGQLKKLSSMTGQTIGELSTRLNNLASNEDNRDILRKMGRSQRLDYIQTQAKLLTQYTTLTGNVDRASEIMHRQIAGTQKTAKERFIESFKTRQAAVLSGMDTKQADEFQNLLAMNRTLLLQDEQKTTRLQQLAGIFHQNIKQLEGSGDFYTENLGNVLAQLGNVGDFGVYNTETDSPLLATNITQQNERSISTAIDSNDILKSSLTWLQRIEAGVTNVVSLLVVGGIASLVSNASSIRGAAGSLVGRAGLKGATVATTGASMTAGAMTLLKNPKLLTGLAGAVTTIAGFAIDKLVETTTEKGTRQKNTAVGALEWAGVGMMVGAFAGPIGAAVGAAIGGVAGAIHGYTDIIKEQALMDVEQKQQTLIGETKLMQARHGKSIIHLNEQLANEQKLLEQASGNERQQHLQKIENLNNQITQEQELFNVKVQEANAMKIATDALVDKLTQKHNVNEGLDQAIEYSMFGTKQFDVKEFTEASGMSNSELIDSIFKHTSDVITAKQAGELTKQIVSNEKIQDKDLLNIIENVWAERYSSELHKQTQTLADQAETQRKKLSEVANSEIIVTVDGQIKQSKDNRMGMFETPIDTDIRKDALTKRNEARETMVARLQITPEQTRSLEMSHPLQTDSTQMFSNDSKQFGLPQNTFLSSIPKINDTVIANNVKDTTSVKDQNQHTSGVFDAISKISMLDSVTSVNQPLTEPKDSISDDINKIANVNQSSIALAAVEAFAVSVSDTNSIGANITTDASISDGNQLSTAAQYSSNKDVFSLPMLGQIPSDLIEPAETSVTSVSYSKLPEMSIPPQLNAVNDNNEKQHTVANQAENKESNVSVDQLSTMFTKGNDATNRLLSNLIKTMDVNHKDIKRHSERRDDNTDFRNSTNSRVDVPMISKTTSLQT